MVSVDNNRLVWWTSVNHMMDLVDHPNHAGDLQLCGPVVAFCTGESSAKKQDRFYCGARWGFGKIFMLVVLMNVISNSTVAAFFTTV